MVTKLWITLDKIMGYKWTSRHQNDPLGWPHKGNLYFLSRLFLEGSTLPLLKQKGTQAHLPLF